MYDMDTKSADQKITASSHDIELGEINSTSPPPSSEEHVKEDPSSSRVSRFYHKYKIWFDLAGWMIITGWWAASLGLHHADKNWVIPFLLWLAISLRLLTCHVPISIVTTPMHWIWNNSAVKITSTVPEKWRLPLGAVGAIAVILVGSFASAENADNTRANRAISLFGLVVFMAGLYATSRNRKAINWHTIIVGMLMQYIIALFVLRTSVGYDIFAFISGLARSLLGFAKAGVAFLTSDTTAATPSFFFSVIPAIIFFVSLVQLLYYWGTLQWFVCKAAVFFFWAMKISGAESVVVAATPYVDFFICRGFANSSSDSSDKERAQCSLNPSSHI